MLMLNIAPNEVIYVGDDIVITHCGPNLRYPGQIKLGFDAPRHINIIRKEVIDRLTKNQKAIIDGNL